VLTNWDNGKFLKIVLVQLAPPYPIATRYWVRKFNASNALIFAIFIRTIDSNPNKMTLSDEHEEKRVQDALALMRENPRMKATEAAR
jgi:hypothetical protein